MAPKQKRTDDRLFSRIYELVRTIPRGRVATYGQIAKCIGRCSPQMIGFSMAAVPHDTDIPWQRVINFKGQISPRGLGDGEFIQRVLLEAEGIVFEANDCVDLSRFQWKGPADW